MIEEPGNKDNLLSSKGNSFVPDSPKLRARAYSPAYYLLVTTALVFGVEFGIMHILSYFSIEQGYAYSLIDAVALTAAAFPFIYLLVIRPLRQEVSARRSSEERLLMLKEAIESMQLGVSITDLEGRIIYCNPAEAHMHGYEVDELRGRKAHVLSPPERWKQLGPGELKNMCSWKRERSNLRKDGSTFPVQLVSNPVRDPDGQPIGTITNCEDITMRKQAEQALQESEARYRSLVESTADSIYLVDKDFKYIYMNRKHLRRLGISNDDIVGKKYSLYHNRNETEDFIGKVQEVLRSGISTRHEHRSNRDGRYFLRSLSPVRDLKGNIIAVTVISKDITELKEMEEKLRTLSLTDSLTGLYNRRGLKALGEQQIKLANRLKKKVVILYADLDDLKKVNDALGHSEGDRLLMATATLLRETFRNSDIIARIGGDEFVCMSVEMDDYSGDGIYKRVLEKVDEFNASQRRDFALSLSFGVSYYDPADPSTLEELLARADKSMYQLKKSKQKAQ